MLKLAIRFRGTCRKHPKYNPVTDTPAELDQACRYCLALAAIHSAYQQLIAAMREFPERYREYPAQTSQAANNNVSQLALFVPDSDQDPH